MATVTRRIEVCDVCREIENPVTQHVRIALEGKRLKTFAFCDKDVRPLLKTIEAITAGFPNLDESRRGSKQVTMEQIEQVKATRKRAARKTGTTTRQKVAVGA